MPFNASNFTANSAAARLFGGNLAGARSLPTGMFGFAASRVRMAANATGPNGPTDTTSAGPTPAGSIPSGKCESAGCQRIKNTNVANNGGLYCCITCKANADQHGRSCSNALYAETATGPSEPTTE